MKRERTAISVLKRYDGQTVRICGFVVLTRVLKRVLFVIVQDRAGQVQITVDRTEPPSALETTVLSLTIGSAIEVVGTVVSNPAVKAGGIEVRASQITIQSLSDPIAPIQEESAPEAQLDWRFLALRWPKNQRLFEIQTAVEAAMRDFLVQRRFIEIHSPKLMHSASESGSETFSMQYFDLGRAYLAQSPQFYKQMAMAAGFERVFEFGPVFRAEPSMTPRHATEFVSVDLEVSWIESHEDVMDLEEEWLAFVLQRIATEYGAGIKALFGTDVVVPKRPFPRITMADAHELLRGAGHRIAPATKPGDLDPAGERLLASHFLETARSEFFFLTDYPIGLRPFYHMRDPDRPELTRSFDLYWKGIEVTTGAQREHRYEVLARQAAEAGLESSVSYYLDFFRFGCPPHGGLGFGLARMIMLLLNLPSIREAVFLHRSPNRLTP